MSQSDKDKLLNEKPNKYRWENNFRKDVDYLIDLYGRRELLKKKWTAFIRIVDFTRVKIQLLQKITKKEFTMS